MGLTSWVGSAAGAVGDGFDSVSDDVVDAVDAVGDEAEDLASAGSAVLGSGVEGVTRIAEGRLDAAGLTDAADWVREHGNELADRLGAQVGERSLGETDDPTQLVHGDPQAIQDDVDQLAVLGNALGEVADGLGAISTGDWAGDGADAFWAAWDRTPGDWAAAKAACHEAAAALSGYGDTVSWAQGQAAEAIRRWNAATHAQHAALAAHRAAATAYNGAVDAYNLALRSGASPGPPPTRPAPFHDPGPALFQAAIDTLAEARRQRNEAAVQAAARIRHATATAPPLPAFHDRMGADASDAFDLYWYHETHVAAGFLTGAGDLVRSVRALNATDPANLAHPADYVAGLDRTAAALVTSAVHPGDVVTGLAGSGWGDDPAEAAGRALPGVLVGVATGGTGTAAESAALAAGRLAERAAARAAGRFGRRAAEVAGDAAKTAEHARPRRAVVGCNDPVDVATGAVFLDQTDLTLPGALPLVVSRRHLSSWTYGQWFGPTWSSLFDERIDLADGHAVVVRADAQAVVFPLPEEGRPVAPLAGEDGELGRTELGGFRLTEPATGHVRHYLPPVDGRAPLAAVTDPDGHHLVVVRDRAGAPVELRHSAGHRVRVETSDDRVTGLAVVRTDGGADEADGLAEAVYVARYEYADGHLAAVRTESEEPLRFEYDAAGRLTAWIDRNGTAYTYAYDGVGRCVDQSGTDGVMAGRFAYADLGDGRRETAFSDGRGVTRFVVDERLRVVAETDPLGHETTSEWDDRDRLVRRTDPLGRTTAYSYDDAGNLALLIRPDGSRQSVRWTSVAGVACPLGTVLPDGTAWTFAYDDRGHRTAVTDPTGATTRFGYDERGHLASVTDAGGATRTIATDAAGLPVLVTEPDGAATRLERDAFGRVVAITDALGGRTELGWTVAGLLASRTLPDGSTERWDYDGEGNPVAHVDPAGRTTRTTYTHFDLPASVTGPDGATTRYRYDPQLRLTAVTGPHGRTWSYAYDAAGRLVSETDFDGRTLRFEYDAAGQLVRRVNGAGQVVELERDVLGRVARRRAGAAATRFSHDPLGRLLRATTVSPGAPDVEVALQRDPVGRVIAESIDGRNVSSAYDIVGRRTARTTPAGVEAAWAYDASRALESLVVGAHRIAFHRDVLGRETRRELGAAVLDQSWDLLGRLVGQTLALPAPSMPLGERLEGGPLVGRSVTGAPAGAATVLQARAYAYAVGGRLVGVDDRLSGARRFELDLADRILAVGGGLTEAYAYDPMGNVVRAATGAGGDAERREYDGTLLRRAGRTRYSYDAQGRLVRKTRPRLSRKAEVWHYEWDADDRLVGLRTPDGTRWTYLYDALGRRVAKRRLDAAGAVAEETRFAWDGMTLVEETTASGSRSWVHDGLAPLAQVESSAALPAGLPAGKAPAGAVSAGAVSREDVDARFFAIVTDLVGAPTELVAPDGDLVWHARRTLWGAPASPDSEPTPLRFPGQYADPESGLFYNVQRYYDPDTARYLSQDPLGLAPAPHPGAYVSNPTVLADPLGLAPYAPAAERGTGELTALGDGSYRSPSGLRYGPDPNPQFATRVDHVIAHGTDNLGRRVHGVFTGDPIALTDEAWARVLNGDAVSMSEGGRSVHYVNMGREIGYIGGRVGAETGNPAVSYIKLVTKGSGLITSFPVSGISLG